MGVAGKKLIFKFFIGSFFLGALLACDAVHEGENKSTKQDIPLSKVLQEPETITFETVKTYVLNDACLRCHSGGRLEGRVDLSTLDAVLSTDPDRRGSVVPFDPQRSLMFNTLNATGQRLMPPAGQQPLDQEQKDLIEVWIQNGAIGEVGQTPSKPLTLQEELQPFFDNPESIDYATVNKHVFSESCNECHSKNGSKPDQSAIDSGDFTDYAALMDPFLEIVNVGRPTRSELFRSTADQSMPPAQDGYDPVNAWKVRLLRLWILNCAVETVPAKDQDKLIAGAAGKEKVRDCAKDPGVDPPEKKPISEVLEKPELIIYDTVRTYVLDNNCIDCHGGDKTKAGIDLTSVKIMTTPGKTGKISLKPFDTEGSTVYNTLIAQGDRHMPPLDKPQLTDEEILLVKLWVANGGPEIVGGDKPPVPPSLKEELDPYFKKPETIDYLAVNKHVFSENCNDCHSSNGSKPDDDAITYGADTTSYDTLLNNPFLEVISKGKPNKSDLFESVALQEMPAAADGYDPVHALRVKLLRLWILNCAIEDYSKVGDDTLLDKPKLEKVRDCSAPKEIQPPEAPEPGPVPE